MINELNDEALQIVKLLEKVKITTPKTRPPLRGTLKEKGFTDLSDRIIGGLVERTIDHNGKTLSIHSLNSNVRIGFNEIDYLKFRALVDKYYSIEPIKKNVSINFIEEHSFKWLIESYKNKSSETSLYDYLLNIIKSEVKPISLYFPMFNIEIDSPFKVGNVEFTFLTKEYFDSLFIKVQRNDKTVTKEIFKDMFRKDFQGTVLAKVIVTAEKNKAEDLARSEAEIAVDVLKLYSESAFVPEKRTMFDLNFRLGYQVQSKYLNINPEEPDTPLLNININNEPFYFNKRLYSNALKGGLNIFSNYITSRQNSELQNLTIQSIKLFSSSISNWDLHIRCINLITILESILLKNNEENRLEQKVKVRLSKALTEDQNEKEKIKEVFGRIYLIRHKMIHKANRLPINNRILSSAQIYIIKLFFRLIHFDTKSPITDKSSLIEYLNGIKS